MNAGFAHDALLFGNDETFTGALVPWLAEGLELGHAAAIVTTRANIALLRERIPPGDAVRYVDRDTWYLRPMSTLAGWVDLVAAAGAEGRPAIRVVGEVPFASTERDRMMWLRYESVLNHALRGTNAWIVCPYDMRHLPEGVVEHAWRTHPVVWSDRRRPSDRYLPPEEFLERYADRRTRPTEDPVLHLSLEADLSSLRRIVASTGSRAGLPQELVENLTVVFNELAANAHRHGVPPRTADLWVTDGGVVCEVRDGGDGPRPLAGYDPPQPGALNRRGLWIARLLSSWLEIDSSPEGGTAVRFGISPDD
ncbi:MAG: anti-sigma factor RsbA family regulatory protein [Candidatus Velamenicoccus archaeovorus]